MMDFIYVLRFFFCTPQVCRVWCFVLYWSELIGQQLSFRFPQTFLFTQSTNRETSSYEGRFLPTKHHYRYHLANRQIETNFRRRYKHLITFPFIRRAKNSNTSTTTRMHFHFLLRGQLGGLAVRYSKSNLIKTLSSPNPRTLVSHYRRVNRGVQSPIQRVSTTMTTTNKDTASGSASFRSQRQQRNNGRHHQDQIHLIKKNSHHQYTVTLSTLCRGTLCGMSSSSGDPEWGVFEKNKDTQLVLGGFQLRTWILG